MATDERQVKITDALIVRAQGAQQAFCGIIDDAIAVIEALQEQSETLRNMNELFKAGIERLKEDNELLSLELEECE